MRIEDNRSCDFISVFDYFDYRGAYRARSSFLLLYLRTCEKFVVRAEALERSSSEFIHR